MIELLYKFNDDELILSNGINKEFFMNSPTVLNVENSIEEIIDQIEISWKMDDFDGLFDYLQQFYTLLQDSQFQLPSDFFDSNTISIIFFMLSNLDPESEEKADKLFNYPIHIQNLLLNIINALLEKHIKEFTPSLAIDLIQHIVPIIEMETEDQIKKCLSFILLLCRQYPEMYSMNIIDPLYFIQLFSRSNHTSNSNCIYDGDTRNEISYFLKEILVLLPPTKENIQLIFENSHLDPNIFIVFLKFIKKNPEYLENFDPDIYLKFLYEIFQTQYDYSILASSVEFCYAVNNHSKTGIDIQHIFSLISKINENIENSPIPEKLTILLAMCLNFISHFAKSDVQNSIIVLENGIVEMIKEKISSEWCQYQLKREAARCLFEIISKVHTQYYQLADLAIVELFLNILDYNDSTINTPILFALDKLIVEEQGVGLNDVYNFCEENIQIFESLSNDENEETASNSNQFMLKYKFSC